MAKNFYHDFLVGFNWWYITLPLILIYTWKLGRNSIRLSRDKFGERKIVSNLKKGFLKNTIKAFSIALMLQILIESGAGLTQFFINLLSQNDAAVWGDFLMVSSIVVLGVLLYSVLMRAAEFSRDFEVDRIISYLKRRDPGSAGAVEYKWRSRKREIA